MSKKIASWEHPYQTNALNASIEKKKKKRTPEKPLDLKTASDLDQMGNQ